MKEDRIIFSAKAHKAGITRPRMTIELPHALFAEYRRIFGDGEARVILERVNAK